MERLLFLFMVFSIIGWLWETPFVSLKEKKYVNRGFLVGPYIPIYGLAVVTIIYSMELFNNIDLTGWYFVIGQIIFMGLVTAVWEFFTSWILEKLFHTRWWDYSSHKYNLQGRVSLHVTVFFGLGGFTLYHFVLPLVDSLFTNSSSTIMMISLGIFYIGFTIDSVFTLRDLFTVRSMMISIEKLSSELRDKLEDSYEDLKIKLTSHKIGLYKSLQDTKEDLEKKYKQSKQLITPRIKKELEKLSNTVSTNKYIRRFYKKFPNSTSIGLSKAKNILQSISKKGGKEE